MVTKQNQRTPDLHSGLRAILAAGIMAASQIRRRAVTVILIVLFCAGTFILLIEIDKETKPESCTGVMSDYWRGVCDERAGHAR